MTGTMVGETTSPGFRTGRVQERKQNRAEKRGHRSCTWPVTGWLGGLDCSLDPCAWPGLGKSDRWGILGSNPRFVQLLRADSLSPAFPTTSDA